MLGGCLEKTARHLSVIVVPDPWGFDVLIDSKLRFAQGGHALGRAVTS